MHKWSGNNSFPSVITVFSAPNYCGSYKNKGAVILIENEKMNIKQYKDVEQPFNLPGGLDLFTWSLPFLVDKIGEMMDHVLLKNSIVSAKEIHSTRKTSVQDFSKIIEELNKEKKEQDIAKFNKIKAKVLTMGRISLMLKNKRNKHEEILLKAVQDNKKPEEEEKQEEIEKHFEEIVRKDSISEAFPMEVFKRRQTEILEAGDFENLNLNKNK